MILRALPSQLSLLKHQIGFYQIIKHTVSSIRAVSVFISWEDIMFWEELVEEGLQSDNTFKEHTIPSQLTTRSISNCNSSKSILGIRERAITSVLVSIMSRLLAGSYIGPIQVRSLSVETQTQASRILYLQSLWHTLTRHHP